jgi:hypothetical protein
VTRLRALLCHRYTWWMAGAVNFWLTQHYLFLLGAPLFVVLEIAYEKSQPQDSTREGDA